MSGDSSAATSTGSLLRNGLAKTVTESSETASSTPLRSSIVPRLAGSSMSSICWLTARSDRDPALTVPSQVARRAARPSSRRNVASFDEDEGALLKRNPNYHGSRPQRPRQIRFTVGVKRRQGLAHVESGSAD